MQKTIDAKSAPRRRTKRGEVVRKQIIDAAIACLDELGYAGTSVEAVIVRAGVSRGSVLNQFPTRIALMAAASEAAMRAMMAVTQEKLAAIPDPAQRYRALCDIYWHGQKMPEGAAVTEVLLAARRDEALALAFRPVATRIENAFDPSTAERARAAGICERDIDACQLHSRLLILALRGITLELTFDPDRAMINRALAQIRALHAAHCDRVLPRA